MEGLYNSYLFLGALISLSVERRVRGVGAKEKRRRKLPFRRSRQHSIEGGCET